MDNSVVSAAYYVARTRDLNNLAKDVDSLAVKHISVSEINNDLVNRQHVCREAQARLFGAVGGSQICEILYGCG